MKTVGWMRGVQMGAGVLCAAWLVLGATGCASSGGRTTGAYVPSAAVPLPDGVVLERHPHLQGVWMAEGFRFAGFDGVVVEEPVFRAVERENEAMERAAALRTLRDVMGDALRDTGQFARVWTRREDVAAGVKAAVLSMDVVEYEKGGGAARYFAGLYGAGQPVIRVRGRMSDAAGLPVFVFEAKRSGESAGARFFGGIRTDVEIQAEDIRDLGVDLRDYVKAHAGEIR